MARTKQTARKSTGGKLPRKDLYNIPKKANILPQFEKEEEQKHQELFERQFLQSIQVDYALLETIQQDDCELSPEELDELVLSLRKPSRDESIWRPNTNGKIDLDTNLSKLWSLFKTSTDERYRYQICRIIWFCLAILKRNQVDEYNLLKTTLLSSTNIHLAQAICGILGYFITEDTRGELLELVFQVFAKFKESDIVNEQAFQLLLKVSTEDNLFDNVLKAKRFRFT